MRTRPITTDPEVPGSLRRSRTRTRAATALVGAGIAAAAILGLATPASASGTSLPDLKACFTSSNGTGVYPNLPINLFTASGRLVRSGRTNASSCGTFVDVPQNSTYYVQGYYRYNVSSAVYAWIGYTPTTFVGGGYDRLYQTQTGDVDLYRLS